MIAPIAVGACVWAAHELYVAFVSRRVDRRTKFRAAVERARRLGKPLLVVGDPDTGFVTKHFGRDYQCGTLCTDLTGCPRCPTRLRGRLEDVLPQLPSRSAVIFASATLEYVDDLPRCVRELERVAVPGGLFVVALEPGSSTFWLYPGAKWVLTSVPPRRWAWRPYRGAR